MTRGAPITNKNKPVESTLITINISVYSMCLVCIWANDKGRTEVGFGVKDTLEILSLGPVVLSISLVVSGWEQLVLSFSIHFL